MPASLALMQQAQGSEIMRSRLTLATLLIAIAMMPSALAQSASSTNFQTKPMQTAPTAGSNQTAPKIPPAARWGGGGIRVGPGTNEKDDGIVVKRIK